MNTQKGFSLVEGLLIILILAVVGFGGWYVWDSNNDEQTAVDNYQKSANIDQSNTEPAPNQKTENQDVTTVHQVNIDGLSTENDLSKLPDYTPDSFVDYFSAILKENENSSGTCSVNTYEIYTISSDRITGGVKPTENGDASKCSGAPISWALGSDGVWSEESIQ